MLRVCSLVALLLSAQSGESFGAPNASICFYTPNPMDLLGQRVNYCLKIYLHCLLPVVVAALITFVVSPMNTSVLQDGSVVLRCLVASDGTLVRISWLKDGNVIPADRSVYATALTPV